MDRITKRMVRESSRIPTPFPYWEGKIMQLTVGNKPLSLQGGTQFKILKVFEPPTLSVAMLVEYEVEAMAACHKIHTPRAAAVRQKQSDTYRALRSGKRLELQPNRSIALRKCKTKQIAVLKLYDWRHAKGLRANLGCEAWTPYQNDLYTDFVLSGDAEKLLHTMEATGVFDGDTPSELNNMEGEMYIWCCCQQYFTREVATYKHLSQLQGLQIPQLYNVVGTPLDGYQQVGSNQMLYVSGILLEYIHGFTLQDLTVRTKREHWGEIVADAVNIIHMLSDNNVRNEDIRLPNFVIRPQVPAMAGRPKYQVFMIDFGHCFIREEDETDADWGFLKWQTDEEGVLMLWAREKLDRYGYHLELQESGRWDVFQEREHPRQSDPVRD